MSKSNACLTGPPDHPQIPILLPGEKELQQWMLPKATVQKQLEPESSCSSVCICNLISWDHGMEKHPYMEQKMMLEEKYTWKICENIKPQSESYLLRQENSKNIMWFERSTFSIHPLLLFMVSTLWFCTTDSWVTKIVWPLVLQHRTRHALIRQSNKQICIFTQKGAQLVF